MVGTVFFHAQKLVGMAPEAADVTFIGPGTGTVPETSALRSFKRTGEQPKLVVVRRGNATAVFGLGGDSQSIRTHGLYVPVEPDTIRGDQQLVERLKRSDRVHLCRNAACTEEGGEHFLEYGVVCKFNPERFQSAQAHQGAVDAGRTLWSWLQPPKVGMGVNRLVNKVKEYASESEAEDSMPCAAGRIRWNGTNGIECLAPSRCTAPGSLFHPILHEDVPEGLHEVGLCPKHSNHYMSQRAPMKCCVINCQHEGTKLRSSVRWCVEHCCRESRPTSTSRRSRSRSRARRTEDEGHTEAEEGDDGYEEDEDNGPPTAQTLLREAVDAGLPPSRTRKRPPSRSPGHTPKAGIHRSLAKIGMLDSPGTDLGSWRSSWRGMPWDEMRE